MAIIPGLESVVTPGIDMSEQTKEDLHNYANEAAVVQRVKSEIIPMIEQIRSRRAQLNSDWENYFKVWSLEHEHEEVEGASRIYVPAGKKASETLVSQLVGQTFPGDEEFSVAPRRSEHAQRASGVREAMAQRIDSVMKVRLYGERFYRQLVGTGNSPVKIYYDKRTIKKARRRSFDPARKFMPEQYEHVLYDGPVLKTIEARNLYVYPEDAETFDDLQVVFEDLTTTLADLKIRAAKGTYAASAIAEVQKGGSNEGENYQRNLQAQGLAGGSGHSPGWNAIHVTEIWLDFDPKASCKEDEEYPEPFLITVSRSGAVLRVQRNPYWHKRPPYRIGRMGTVTGRFYGTGAIEGIRQLQILLNAQVNQGMDAANYTLNPIFLTNPNLVFGTQKPLSPGVQYFVSDINQAMKTITPDSSVIQSTAMLSTQTQAWINDFSGAPPVLSGGSMPGRAFRTATGIGTAQTNAIQPLAEMVSLCEEEVWEPMLQMVHSLDQQFAEDDFLFWAANGTEPRRLSARELAGDFHFKWMASRKTASRSVQGSQILQALQIMSNPAIIQQLQANGVSFNPAPLVRRLYRDVLGFRDTDELIKTAPPAQGQEVRGPGAPPAAQSAPVDQTYNLPPGLGENEQFQEQREQGDVISAMMGAANMPGGEEGAA